MMVMMIKVILRDVDVVVDDYCYGSILLQMEALHDCAFSVKRITNGQSSQNKR